MEFLELSREIEAKAKIQIGRNRCQYVPTVEVNLPVMTDEDCFDARDYDKFYIRAITSGGYIWFSSISTTDTYYCEWTKSSISVYPGSGISLVAGNIWFQRPDGRVCISSIFDLIVGHNIAQPINGDDGIFNSPVALAGVGYSEVYIIYRLSGSGFGMIYHNTGEQVISRWPGAFYENVDTPMRPTVSMISHEGVNFIYFTDARHERSYYLRHKGNWWGEVEPILPIDVLDDMASLDLAGASVINNIPFVFGRYARPDSNFDMLVFLRGPDEFSMGRDIFIHPTTNLPYRGSRMFEFDIYVVLDNIGYRILIDRNNTFNYLDQVWDVETSNIHNLSISNSSNSAANLELELNSDLHLLSLIPGSIISLYASFNGEEQKLGVFDIDGVVEAMEPGATSMAVSARSLSMKRLANWESDAPYDYWSQTKLVTNPKSLEDVIRITGKYSDDEVWDGLKTDELNIDGILYANAKSGHGGQIAAEFVHPSSVIKLRCGVGLNYYRETKGQAAERLGIKYEDVGENDYGNNGIFALMEEKQNGFYFSIYNVRDNVWTQLSSYQMTEEMLYSPGWPFWIMLTFQDGWINGYYRQSDTLWNKLISLRFDLPGMTPWKRDQIVSGDQIGRGAILLNGTTFTTTCVPFRTEDKFVPVMDNSGFPTPEELPIYWGDKVAVKVGSELIKYNRKSRNEVLTDLSVSPGVEIAAHTGTDTLTEFVFANSRERNYVSQSFTISGERYITGVSVYVKKLNYPDDGLMIAIARSPRTSSGPLGRVVARGNIASENISSEGDWATVMFERPVAALSNDWILMTRGKDAAHPSALSYYSCFLDSTPGYAGGKFQRFDEREPDEVGQANSDIWYNVTGDLLFRLYALPVPTTDSYYIMIQTKAGMSTEIDYYKDMALYAYEGEGTGNTYRITGYKYGASVSIFYVERKSTQVGPNTKMMIVPTLLDAVREKPIPHSKEKSDWYPEAPCTSALNLRYFTSETDKSIADVAEIIAKKAGVYGFVADQTFPETIIPSSTGNYLLRKNAMLHIQYPVNPGEVIFSARTNKVLLKTDTNLTATAIELWIDNVLQEEISCEALRGDVLVSFYDDTVSLWCNCSLVCSFVIPDTEDEGFNIFGSSAKSFGVRLREADIRHDNFLLDTGAKGDQLLARLIGEKRYYYQDNVDGVLRLFGERKEINSPSSPYDLAVETSTITSDNGTATRVRLEGAEIWETIDEKEALDIGNIYREMNMSEINNLTDAKYYSNAILNDLTMRRVVRNISGPVDPRIFPDCKYHLAAYHRGGSVEYGTLIVDSITKRLAHSDTGIEFDMDVAGFYKVEGFLPGGNE